MLRVQPSTLAQELEQSAPTLAPRLDGVGTGHVGGGRGGGSAAHRSALAAAGARQVDNESAAASAPDASHNNDIDQAGFLKAKGGRYLRRVPGSAEGDRLLLLATATKLWVHGTASADPTWVFVTIDQADQPRASGFLARSVVQLGGPKSLIEGRPPDAGAQMYHVERDGEGLMDLVAQRYAGFIAHGLDQRFFCNALLYVDRQAYGADAVIRGDYYRDGAGPGMSLRLGTYLWLVSPQYALQLAQSVPEKDLPHGAGLRGQFLGLVESFAQGMADLGTSLEAAFPALLKMAQEMDVLQIIEDQLPILGAILGGYVVGNGIAMLIAPGAGPAIFNFLFDLLMAAWGSEGAVVGLENAATFGWQWMSTAWNARGHADQIAFASEACAKMILSIVMAVLSLVAAMWGLKDVAGAQARMMAVLGRTERNAAKGVGEVGGGAASKGPTPEPVKAPEPAKVPEPAKPAEPEVLGEGSTSRVTKDGSQVVKEVKGEIADESGGVLKVTAEEANEVANITVRLTNDVRVHIPDLVPEMKLVGPGKIGQDLVKGIPEKKLVGGVKNVAKENARDLYYAVYKLVGDLRNSTGSADWIARLDLNVGNFFFDEAGNVVSWFDPVAVEGSKALVAKKAAGGG